MRGIILLDTPSPLIGNQLTIVFWDTGAEASHWWKVQGPAYRERTCASVCTPRLPTKGIGLEEGIYVGLTGPTYETPAEVRMLAGLGGHAVGMSTVLECIAARWVGLDVCGVSLVTNAGAGYAAGNLAGTTRRSSPPARSPGRASRAIRRFLADLPAEG